MSSHESMVSLARFISALLAGVLALSLAHDAQAQEQEREQEQSRRIVLMPFAGSGAKHVRRAAAESIIRESHEIIPDRDYRRAARKRNAQDFSAESIALVAADIGADAVLVGQVDRTGGQRVATLRLLAGKTGAEVAEIRIELRRRRPSQEEQDELRTQLTAALAALAALDEPEPEPADDVPVTFAPGALSAGDDNGNGNDDGEAGAEADAEDASMVSAPDTIAAQATPAEASPASRTRAGIDAAVGLSFTSRILRASTALDDIRGPTYTGEPAPGAYIDAEVYPLALDLPFDVPARGVLSNLGIHLVFDRVFALTSELPYTDAAAGAEMTAELGTKQMHVGVGLLYRHFFGDGATAPMLLVGAGYDRLQFSVDKADAPAGVPVDLPNVDYTSFDPTLGFRYPLSEALALTGTGRLLLTTSTGNMGRADQFGDGSTMGFDLGAEVEYRLAARMSVRAGLRFLNITTALDGNGAQSNGRDGDSSTVDVTGITDRFIGGHVTAGYAF